MSLLNISFKLHILAPCPNAPRKLPQSSSSPELRCGLPRINNPWRSEHLHRRLRPKLSRGLSAPRGLPAEADAAGQTPHPERPWGGERRRQGTGSVVCLALLSGTQTRRGSEVGGEAAVLWRWSSTAGAGREGSSRGCKGGREAKATVGLSRSRRTDGTLALKDTFFACHRQRGCQPSARGRAWAASRPARWLPSRPGAWREAACQAALLRWTGQDVSEPPEKAAAAPQHRRQPHSTRERLGRRGPAGQRDEGGGGEGPSVAGMGHGSGWCQRFLLDQSCALAR